MGLAYANLPCIGAEVQLPFSGVKKSGHSVLHAREATETVIDRTAWTLNNNQDIDFAHQDTRGMNGGGRDEEPTGRPSGRPPVGWTPSGLPGAREAVQRVGSLAST